MLKSMESLPIEIQATIASLRTVRNPRYLATERGFQGAFYCALRSELDRHDLLSEERILEMEYQKSSRHGLSQRPDIVFHIPAELSGASVEDNNFAVWALKRCANASDATADFEKLDQMCERLKYPLAIFLNLCSPETFLENYHGQYSKRMHAIAVPDSDGNSIHHSHYQNGKLLRAVYNLK